jgi:hypothetical protein
MAILIKTEQLGDIGAVEQDLAYLDLLEILHTHGRHIVLTPAHSMRRIADVPAGDSLHLFNHFLTAGPHAHELWEHLAGWYQHEMGLTNSELLARQRRRGAPLPLPPDRIPSAGAVGLRCRAPS